MAMSGRHQVVGRYNLRVRFFATAFVLRWRVTLYVVLFTFNVAECALEIRLADARSKRMIFLHCIFSNYVLIIVHFFFSMYVKYIT